MTHASRTSQYKLYCVNSTKLESWMGPVAVLQKMKMVYQDQVQAGPEGTSKLYEQVAQTLMLPFTAALVSLSQPVPMAL